MAIYIISSTYIYIYVYYNIYIYIYIYHYISKRSIYIYIYDVIQIKKSETNNSFLKLGIATTSNMSHLFARATKQNTCDDQLLTIAISHHFRVSKIIRLQKELPKDHRFEVRHGWLRVFLFPWQRARFVQL